MQLSKEAIDEYRALHKKEFGQTITRLEANEAGLRLLGVFGIIYKPFSQNEMRDNGQLHPNKK